MAASLARQALDDALATARVQLATERRAIACCRALGYLGADLAFARSEAQRLEALVARLDARRREEAAG